MFEVLYRVKSGVQAEVEECDSKLGSVNFHLGEQTSTQLHTQIRQFKDSLPTDSMIFEHERKINLQKDNSPKQKLNRTELNITFLNHCLYSTLDSVQNFQHLRLLQRQAIYYYIYVLLYANSCFRKDEDGPLELTTTRSHFPHCLFSLLYSRSIPVHLIKL